MCNSLPVAVLVSLRREEQDLQRSCQSKVQSLRQMEAGRSNRIRRFGEHMPALLNAIDEAYSKGMFQKKPVGPLGQNTHTHIYTHTHVPTNIQMQTHMPIIQYTSIFCFSYTDDKSTQDSITACLLES